MKNGVIGLGNALIDILTHVSDAFLAKHNLPKGSMQLVGFEKQNEVFEDIHDFSRSAGGCAANTVTALGDLSIDTGFIGKVGSDSLGKSFTDDLEGHGVKSFIRLGHNPTGSCMALITPDGERTFATYLGAAIELMPKDVEASMLEGYRYMHIEGYLVQNHDLVREAFSIARETGTLISLDLASYNVVTDNLSFLKEIIGSGIGIIFANEEEAKAFTGKDAEEAVNDIASICEIAVVKLGSKGSIIKRGTDEEFIEINPVVPVDTTGAGDLYAAGFLYGLLKDYPLKRCGNIGSLLSREVVQIMGTKFDANTWERIKQAISL
jgi:sugar/nucleoside kinase (ribokinase family)